MPNPDSSAALHLVHTAAIDEAHRCCASGYCPVECSFGADSVIDELQLDHHGALAALAPVSIRAYCDHYGARVGDLRFIVTGAADADATFAITALAGLVPLSSGMMTLAQAVAKADMNPFAERWEESPEGVLLLAFKQQMANSPNNSDSFRKGVALWQALANDPPAEMLASVQAKERERVQQARLAKVTRIHPMVAFVESPAWGWDIWYSEIAPVIVAYQARSGRCSIGCRDTHTAAQLFGPDGLLAVTPNLAPSGWGGRETIVGSPRDRRISTEEALQAGLEVASIPSLPSAIP